MTNMTTTQNTTPTAAETARLATALAHLVLGEMDAHEHVARMEARHGANSIQASAARLGLEATVKALEVIVAEVDAAMEALILAEAAAWVAEREAEARHDYGSFECATARRARRSIQAELDAFVEATVAAEGAEA